ncbi:MAG: CYCXC family (seleno)protein [Gemmatimonadota bacterium]|jgi:hypothetical protein
MSSQSRRKPKKTGPFAREKARTRAMWYKVGGAAALLLVVSLTVSSRAEGAHHPTPRPEMEHSAHVVPAARYEAYPRVARTYEMVAAVPTVIDGIYCYCNCAEHSGHYSLLDCFTSDHAARCDVCLSEATMAYQMSRDGKDLKAIRAEIDSRFQR